MKRCPTSRPVSSETALDDGRDAKALFFDYAAMPSRAKGPSSVRSRYITEDVSQGLVMLESLGHSLDIPTPVASALIELASASAGLWAPCGRAELRGPGPGEYQKNSC